MTTKLRALDGEALEVYSSGNVEKGSILMDGPALKLTGSAAGSHVIIDQGNNLLFAGANAMIGGTTSTILAIGNGTDTISINNLNTVTGAVVFTGTTLFNNVIGATGGLSVGATSVINTSGNIASVDRLPTVTAVKGGTGQTSYAVGDILYASSTTALTKLAKGASGTVLTMGATIPAWSTINTAVNIIEGTKIDVAKAGDNQITVSHEAIAAPTAGAGSGRTYVTGLTFDGYGHVTGFTTASETVVDTQRAIHDTPVDGATTTSISSNWAFDHAANKTLHGVATVLTFAAGETEKSWTHGLTGNYAITLGVNSAERHAYYIKNGTSVTIKLDDVPYSASIEVSVIAQNY